MARVCRTRTFDGQAVIRLIYVADPTEHVQHFWSLAGFLVQVYDIAPIERFSALSRNTLVLSIKDEVEGVLFW